MRNLFIGLLVVAALVIGGGIIAQTAYQAGLSTAVTTAAASAPAGTVVTPVAPAPSAQAWCTVSSDIFVSGLNQPCTLSASLKPVHFVDHASIVSL